MAIGIGSAIGAGLKVGGAILGGIAQSKAAKKQQKRLQQQMKENQDWYDRRYNEDFTQRADAQRLLTMTQDAMRRNNQASAGTAAVMGGSTESVAAAKAANNQVMADTVSQIAADAANQKNAIEQQYMANKSNIITQMNEADAAKGAAIAGAVQGVANAADSIAGGLNDLGSIGKNWGKNKTSED
jgi:hypothetical protein